MLLEGRKITTNTTSQVFEAFKMLIKTTKLQSLIFLVLFFSYLAAHCNGSRREFAGSDADAALAKYEKCLDLCDPLEGQRQEYMCKKKCKEAYEEEIEEPRRSPPSGEEESHGSHGRLEECWKECEDRDEGTQTKFCKKSCETAYGPGRGGGRKPL